MELRNDDLQPITILSNTFSESLQQSRLKTEKIETLLKKISKHTDSNTEQLFTAQPQPESPSSSSSSQTQTQTGLEIDDIDQLRTENLELMIQIQKQEVISSKWREILQQNENILETIKIWIKETPELVIKDNFEIKDQFYELESKYKNSLQGLGYDVKVSKCCIEKLIEILKSVEKIFGDLIDDTSKYNDKKEELVGIIKKMERLQ